MVANFPVARPRRLRRTSPLRELIAETRVTVNDLVAPLFVREGIAAAQPISSLDGVMQHTLESLVIEVGELRDLGVRAVILFGVPATKDAVGSGSFDSEGIVQQAVRRLRLAYGQTIVVMTDLCVDEYTDHGHCGVLTEAGEVDNDLTLQIYAKAAIAQAKAGVDVVAPSGMMDGQVGAIRAALDDSGYPKRRDSGVFGQIRQRPIRPIPRRS